MVRFPTPKAKRDCSRSFVLQRATLQIKNAASIRSGIVHAPDLQARRPMSLDVIGTHSLPEIVECDTVEKRRRADHFPLREAQEPGVSVRIGTAIARRTCRVKEYDDGI